MNATFLITALLWLDMPSQRLTQQQKPMLEKVMGIKTTVFRIEIRRTTWKIKVFYDTF